MADEVFYKMVDGVVIECTPEETAEIIAARDAYNAPEAVYQRQRDEDKQIGQNVWEGYRRYVTLQNSAVNKLAYLAANYLTIFTMLQDGVNLTCYIYVRDQVTPDGTYLTQADKDYFLSLFPESVTSQATQ